MASAYPGALDNLPDSHQDGVNETILAATINNLADAINAVQSILGLDPQGSFATVVARLLALEKVSFNIQNVASYTMVASDIGNVVSMIYASACTVVIPANAAVPVDVGRAFFIRSGPSAGVVTVAGDVGVTVESRGSSFDLAGGVSWVTAMKVGTDTWDLFGDLA